MVVERNLKALTVFLVIFTLTSNLFSQEHNQITRKGWGYGWRLNNEKVKWKVVKEELTNNIKAAPYLKKYQTSTLITYISFISVNAFLILANATRKNIFDDPNNGYRVAGIVCIGISIPFIFSSGKNLRKAVATYNSQ